MQWVKRIAFAVLAVVVVAAALLYGVTEWQLRRDQGVPLVPVAADASPAGVREGERLAAIYSCTGCHADGHGKVFIHAPPFAVIHAPALAPIVASESDAQLARTIREGVTGDGKPIFIMPARAMIAGDDLARILGFLHTLRPAPGDVGRRQSFGPLGRLALLTGGLAWESHLPPTGPAQRPADSGRYFTETVCLACHRMDAPHEVRPGDVAPPLAAMSASYGDAEFARLLRSGVGLSKPDLGLMSEVARQGLHRFSDAEIAGIHAYLKAKAAQ